MDRLPYKCCAYCKNYSLLNAFCGREGIPSEPRNSCINFDRAETIKEDFGCEESKSDKKTVWGWGV